MKFFGFLLFILLGCSSPQVKERNVIDLVVTIDTNSHKLTLPLEFKDGIALIFSDEIDKRLKLKSERTPFSYVQKRNVQIKISEAQELLIFSSFKNGDAKTLTNYVIGFAKPELWNLTKSNTLGTEFTLVTKKNSLINHPVSHGFLGKLWTLFNQKFGSSTDTLTFVELDLAPLSGGPIGENVLGIFTQPKVAENDQVSIQRELGWTPKASTQEYVESYYGKNSWDEYLLGTFSHEMAHTYFGFGLTREKVSQSHELWFSLGLGMVYDMEFTKSLTGRNPQLFTDSERIWESYGWNTQIDQKLINPKTDLDARYMLNRTKVYAHSKAHAYLSTLRKEVGPLRFDQAVQEYLKACSDCTHGYKDFLKFLPVSRTKIHKLETAFKI